MGAEILRSEAKKRRAAGSNSSTAAGPEAATSVPRWALDAALAVVAAPRHMRLKATATLAPAIKRLQELPKPAALVARIIARLVRRLCNVFNMCQALDSQPPDSDDQGGARSGEGDGSDDDDVYREYGTGRHHIQAASASDKEAATASTRAALDAERVHLYHALKQLVPVLAVEEAGVEDAGITTSPKHAESGGGQSLVAGELSQASAIVQHLVLIELDPAKPTRIPVFLGVVRVRHAARTALVACTVAERTSARMSPPQH